MRRLYAIIAFVAGFMAILLADKYGTTRDGDALVQAIALLALMLFSTFMFVHEDSKTQE